MMEERNILKLRVWLPALLGIFIGLVLFSLDEHDDSPGLALIGLISALAAIVLVFYGMYNAAASVSKALIPALFCFFLSAFGFVWTIVLANEGEFNDSPGMMVFDGLICIGLITVDIRFLKSKRIQ